MESPCSCPPLGLAAEYRKPLNWATEGEAAELEEQSQRFGDLSEEELARWEAIGRRVPSGLWLDAHGVECEEHPAVFGYFYGWISAASGSAYVTGRLARNKDGEPVIRDLAVEPDWLVDPDDMLSGGIDGTLMRALPYAEMREQAVGRIAVEADLYSFEEEVGWREPNVAERNVAERATAGASSGARKRGRRGYPDEHYKRIARLYLRLLAQGKRRGILTEIARREGRKPETIRDWVYEARQRGFLTKHGTPGRAGAQPGPNL